MKLQWLMLLVFSDSGVHNNSLPSFAFTTMLQQRDGYCAQVNFSQYYTTVPGVPSNVHNTVSVAHIYHVIQSFLTMHANTLHISVLCSIHHTPSPHFTTDSCIHRTLHIPSNYRCTAPPRHNPTISFTEVRSGMQLHTVTQTTIHMVDLFSQLISVMAYNAALTEPHASQ